MSQRPYETKNETRTKKKDGKKRSSSLHLLVLLFTFSLLFFVSCFFTMSHFCPIAMITLFRQPHQRHITGPLQASENLAGWHFQISNACILGTHPPAHPYTHARRTSSLTRVFPFLLLLLLTTRCSKPRAQTAGSCSRTAGCGRA